MSSSFFSQDSIDRIRDASRLISKTVIGGMIHASGLPEIIGRAAAEREIDERSMNTVADGIFNPASQTYTMQFVGKDAPMSARFVNSILELSGADRVSRNSSSHDTPTDRQVTFHAKPTAWEAIASEAEALSKRLSEKPEAIEDFFRSSQMADKVRSGNGLTKIYPILKKNGEALSLSLNIQTNESSLVNALEVGGFEGKPKSFVRSSDMQRSGKGMDYTIEESKISEALDIITQALGERALNAEQRKLAVSSGSNRTP